MIVILENKITQEQTDNIVKILEEYGFTTHKSYGTQKTVVGVIGVQENFDIAKVKMLKGVADVYRVTAPFKLANRSFKETDTIIKINDIEIGSDTVHIMAGPCSVESEEQIFNLTKVVAQSGAKILRGGAFKPRTSPYSFQGLGEEGLKYMRVAADKYNLAIITEVMDLSQIETVAKYADILQVGMRNMQNFSLLKELGKIDKPVMIKRGISATIEELLMSAEYILASGNNNVILCERGIRSFDPYSRNIFDVSAIPIIHSRSHLPVIADPSHATGFRKYVAPMARAAVAAGADGVMIEIHDNPREAFSDGLQALLPENYKALSKELALIAEIIGKKTY